MRKELQFYRWDSLELVAQACADIWIRGAQSNLFIVTVRPKIAYFTSHFYKFTLFIPVFGVQAFHTSGGPLLGP